MRLEPPPEIFGELGSGRVIEKVGDFELARRSGSTSSIVSGRAGNAASQLA